MQKETISDLELNQKKRARRRLVGAIALVLLMLILLPFVLKDRNASAPQSEITISLPNEKISTDSDFDSTVVPTEVQPEQTVDSTATSPKSETAPIVIDTLDEEAQKSESTTSTKDAVPAKNTDSATQKKVESVKIETPAEQKAAAPKQTEALEHNKKGAFYIQVGVFSDEKNVKQLQTKLSDLGYQSRTEKIDTPKGKKIRLRTQVFNDRNDAAIALENIKDAGLTGMVVSQ
jgi:DedD protein